MITVKITQIIYLTADIEDCLLRIKKRNRGGEEKIDEDYLRYLHKKHEEFFSSNFLKSSLSEIQQDEYGNIFISSHMIPIKKISFTDEMLQLKNSESLMEDVTTFLNLNKK